ncbi:PLP-dependent transferase [Burkholderia stabilis]|uniref:PLP-dependent transferase n=1 Tax=Burkholderia stabilis TaxID=95485 RepID=A0A4Q2A7Z3_9BURK|nr:PLP-dependent transferase [Burkholderia stabilis]RXV65333.1 PLP-dependent transferase [Burkholderia stabilis]
MGLAIRGIRTLPLRLQRHALNARAVTAMLMQEFPTQKWRAAWKTPHAQTNGVSQQLNTGMFYLEFRDRLTAMQFVSALKLIRLAPTFGNVESLCYCYSGFSKFDDIAFDALNIPSGLVRLSIGLEDPADLLADVRQALHACLPGSA